MARSRSASPARASRSRTPKRAAAAPKAAAAPAADEADHTQLGIAVAVLVAVWFRASAGNLSLEGFASQCVSGFAFTFPEIPVAQVQASVAKHLGTGMNFVMFTHALNTVVNNKSRGYWLDNFAQVCVAAFGGITLTKVLAGENFVNAIFADQDGMSLFGFFFMWYVVNNDIPMCPAPLGIWDKVSAFGGDALGNLLGFGSEVFTTNLIIGACSAQTAFTGDWMRAIIMAVVIGTAGSFFPLNKGFKLANSAEAANAMAIAFFLCSGGFGFVDTMVNLAISLIGDFTFGVLVISFECGFGAQVNTAVTGPFGGNNGFVITVVALNYLFGHLVPMATGKGFDVCGLLGHVLELFQL